MSYNSKLCYNDLTTNHENAVSWRMTPEWELYTTVVTTMGTENKFYESGDNRVRRIADLVRKVDPGFVASLAIYAREEMHLRSVPLLLLVELAQCHRDDSLVSRAVSRVVQRADEITELLMCYQWRMGRNKLNKLSSQIRKGLAESFNRFDEYQFAKYNRTNRKVTLRDALLLVHPKPKDEKQAEIFRKILKDTLETPYTWETELSAAGKLATESKKRKSETKQEVWRQLVRSGRLGYMAMLRNLRNMIDCGLDEETMQMVCDRLAAPNEVRKSKQLPFRFLSAYMELADIIDMHPLKFKWTLFEVRSRIEKMETVLNKWKNGDYKVRVRKIKRYNSLSDLCIINRIGRKSVPFAVKLSGTTRHSRRKEYVIVHRDVPTKKNLVKQKQVEKLLYGLKRRMKALEKAMYRKHPAILPVLKALEMAVSYTADNIVGFDENTKVLLASDTSGSMCGSLSENSSVECYHVGLLLSMLMRHKCKNVVAGMFGDVWKEYDFSSDNILQNTIDLISKCGEVGYSTNGYKVINCLIGNKRVIDKVMLFTDCELWDSYSGGDSLAKSWARYKRIAPNAKLYLFNLAGYGTNPIDMKRDDVFCISGWSDKVFDILAALEHGENAIDKIRRIVV